MFLLTRASRNEQEAKRAAISQMEAVHITSWYPKIQWKPFWLSTQLYTQNDWLGGNSCDLWHMRTGPLWKTAVLLAVWNPSFPPNFQFFFNKRVSFVKSFPSLNLSAISEIHWKGMKRESLGFFLYVPVELAKMVIDDWLTTCATGLFLLCLRSQKMSIGLRIGTGH